MHLLNEYCLYYLLYMVQANKGWQAYQDTKDEEVDIAVLKSIVFVGFFPNLLCDFRTKIGPLGPPGLPGDAGPDGRDGLKGNETVYFSKLKKLRYYKYSILHA